MASLTTLLTRAQLSPLEDNLEKGIIYVYSGTRLAQTYGTLICGVNWYPPGCGKAIIEIWGAGGSGGRQCCCAGSIPGNPGAYVQKILCVTPSTYICGQTGNSCADVCQCTTPCAAIAPCTFYYRGRSQASGLCWNNAIDLCGNTAGCLCAEGGYGGTAICVCQCNAGCAGGGVCSPYCVFGCCLFCATQSGAAGCGIICNFGASARICGESGGRGYALAYGGDINCIGCFSCVMFTNCDNAGGIGCCIRYTIPMPGGIASCGQGFLCFRGEGCNDSGSDGSGQGLRSYMYALQAASRFPTQGQHLGACWTSNIDCACYEADGCLPFLPYGFGAPATIVRADVRSSGYRGGLGAVRIKFVCCGSCFYSC